MLIIADAAWSTARAVAKTQLAASKVVDSSVESAKEGFLTLGM